MEDSAKTWKNFEFVPIKPPDFSRVLEHLHTSFYLDEPTQQIMGMDEDRQDDLDQRILSFLKEEMSFMAVCKDTKKIAGAVILTHCSVNKKAEALPPPRSPISTIVRSCLGRMANSVNVYETYGVSEYGEIFIINVGREFRSQGLAQEMTNRAVKQLKEKGYQVLECTFSNPFSRKVGENLGFKEITRTYYAEQKDEFGNRTMPNATPEQFANICVLDLRQANV